MAHHNHHNHRNHQQQINHNHNNMINSSSTFIPTSPSDKESALLSLMDRTGYNVVQENGQRKYGPPPDWVGPSPQKGCEVFIGKIPRDCYEDELVPIFERIGKIYELRLMMDFSGSNRGYAFLMFTKMSDAQRAIMELNNYEIRPRKFIGVVKSVDNCRLFVGGIPKNKTKDDIIEEMKKITDGVVNAIVYSSVSDKNRNRGFAFVEYCNHRAAAMARRKLLPGKIQLWGHEIAVDWADPEPEVDDETMAKVTVLYVRNLNMNTREEQIRDVFSLGPMNLKIEKVKKLRDFAFVHYFTREDAESALQMLSRMNFSHLSNDGQSLEVTWAKPPNNTRTNKRRNKQQLRQNINYSQMNGSNSHLMTSSQTPTLSPAFGPTAYVLSPPFAATMDYHNTFGFLSPRNSPYANSSFGNYPDMGHGLGYLSPASQYLFRGVSLASH